MAGALALAVAGCDTDEIVRVSDPAQLRPEDLNNAGSVPALVNGATRQFIGGYDGFGLDDSFLSSSAVITDETYYGDTFTTREAADKRNLQPVVLGNVTDASYARLHQARFNARRAFAIVQQFSTPGTAKADSVTQAQLRTIEGLVYVTFSEGWCGAVPFSVVPDSGAIDPFAIGFGTSLNTRQMTDTAIARFNEALRLNPANNLAKVALGRALLNAGRFPEAAAAVTSVPTTYVFRLEHSTNTSNENNPMNSLMANGRFGIANLEGGAERPDSPTPSTSSAGAEGIPFRGLRDPRVPWQGRAAANNGCFTSSVRCWLNNNYKDFNADVPLASGIEARLIEAEAAMQANDFARTLTLLNDLRANTAARVNQLYPEQLQVFPATGAIPPLPALTDPGTPDARRALFFQERALWLFNTGHRLGDLRRLARAPYGLPTNTLFPSGAHFRGGTYGNDVAFPVPFNEQNNPNYNPAACNTTVP
jgi:tetratricopeptide (TPR) repeat protein